MRKELTLQASEKLIRIDKDELTDELVKHAQYYADIGFNHVMACDRRDRAKDEMETTEAEKFSDILSKAEKKPTDFTIKQEVSSSTKVKNARSSYRDAKLDAAKWEVMKEAFNQRGFMVNKLAELYITQYYSSDHSRPETDRKNQKRGNKKRNK